MKTLLFALLIGAASAAYQVDPEKRQAAITLMTTDVKDLHNCKDNSDCASVQGKPSCDENLHLCKPEGAPTFPIELGECSGADDQSCPPAYKCKGSKCHFAGPKCCKTEEDCLQGTNVQFACKENHKSYPGKRCYKKCNADADCHERFPEEAKSKIRCCQGTCQKKAAC